MNFKTSLQPFKFFASYGIIGGLIGILIYGLWIDPVNVWMEWQVPFVLGLFVGWTLGLYYKIFIKRIR